MKITTHDVPAAPQRWLALCVAILVVGYVLAVIVPPFQAPDEFDHVKRAYMFGHGQIVLHSVDGSPSGGKVDLGLIDYMNQFTPLKGNANRKISNDEIANANGIRWAGKRSFESPVGTAYYFPVMYAPQAIGLRAGETLQLSVAHSYSLARYLALATSLLALFFAFRLFPPPLFVLAIIALPMNLFLLSSAALDGVSTSMAVLALSAFMRIITDEGRAARGLLTTLAITVALVASCRANMLPWLLLPFAIWWIRRDRFSLMLAIAVAVFVLAWTMYTVKFTVYPPGPRHINHGERLLSYLLHPVSFFSVVFATLSTAAIVSFYAVSFIGVLGWLDTPFPMLVYYILGGLILLIGALSFSQRILQRHPWARTLLVVCAIGAVLLTFLALLVQWTVGPATTVDGVQGRYFTIPVLSVAYAIFGSKRPFAGMTEYARYFLTIMTLAVATYFTVPLLIARYYTAPTQIVAGPTVSLRPSEPLTATRPIPIHFNPLQTTDPAELVGIDLRFGTYVTSHPGQATLRLWTHGGEEIRIPFKLSDLVDNAYKEFRLDGKRYVGGEIVALDGQGVSLYEARSGDAEPINCMVTHTRNGRDVLTTGCPQP